MSTPKDEQARPLTRIEMTRAAIENGWLKKMAPSTMMRNKCTVMALFHYAVHSETLFESETNRDATAFLLANGMIEVKIEQRKSKRNIKHHSYSITEKGDHWLNVVMATPLPTAVTKYEIQVQGVESDE